MNNPNLDRHVLVRMVQIDRQIRSGKYPNANTLAKEFELSPRTMQRDIEAMRDFLGADIEYDSIKKGYYYPEGAPEILPGLKLTDEERFILFLSEQAIPEIEPSMQKSFSSIIKKLYIADELAKDIPDLSKSMSFDFGKQMNVNYTDTFKTIKTAIEKKLTVKMTYYTAYSRERSERLFNPYHLRWITSAWLVIGYCHLRDTFRVFSLANIEKIELTKQTFQIPEDFSAEKFIGNSWGIIRGEPTFIKLKFKEGLAEWIAQRKWHKTQKIVFSEDGSMNLSLTVDGLSEIIPWILGWGTDVEVLEPQLLRGTLKEVATGIQNLYD